MFSEPFKTDLNCLIEVTRFLLRHHNPVHHLWTESIEDLWSPHRVYSLWATADIMLSLLEVAEYLNDNVTPTYRATKEELDNLKDQIAKAVEETSTRLIDVHEQIQRYAISQKSRDLHAVRMAECVNSFGTLFSKNYCRSFPSCPD